MKRIPKTADEIQRELNAISMGLGPDQTGVAVAMILVLFAVAGLLACLLLSWLSDMVPTAILGLATVSGIGGAMLKQGFGGKNG